MIHYCLDKTCGWEERSHKIRDGVKCPKCNGPVMSYYPNLLRPGKQVLHGLKPAPRPPKPPSQFKK